MVNTKKGGIIKTFVSIISLLIIIAVATALGLYFTGKVLPQGKFYKYNDSTLSEDTYIEVSGFKVSKNDQGFGRVNFTVINKTDKKPEIQLIYQIDKIDKYDYNFTKLEVYSKFSSYISKIIFNDDSTVTFKLDDDKKIVVDKVEAKTEERKNEIQNEMKNINSSNEARLIFEYSNKNKQEIIKLADHSATGIFSLIGNEYKKPKK